MQVAIANLIARPKVYDRYRSTDRHSSGIHVRGRIERVGRVVHKQVTRIAALDTGQDSLCVSPVRCEPLTD
jgi:hypothetical protein